MNDFITPQISEVTRDYGLIINVPLDEYRHLVSSEARLIAYTDHLEGMLELKDETIANLNEDLEKAKSDLSIEKFLRKSDNEKHLKWVEEHSDGCAEEAE